MHTEAASHDTGRAYGDGRSTYQRRAVANAAAARSGAFTVDTLVADVQGSTPTVSTATVYRAVAALAASGFLTRVGERDGAALYARCAVGGHHHHLVCTSCGATAHTPCPVDEAVLASSKPDGFVVTSHEIHIYGLCARCAAGSGS